MSAWTDFVTKFYHEKKEKNKDYQFKDALKDGANVKIVADSVAAEGADGEAKSAAEG